MKRVGKINTQDGAVGNGLLISLFKVKRMDTNLVITQENLVVNRGSNSQQHLPIWRDTDGREYVFPNPRAPFSPVPLGANQGRDAQRATRMKDGNNYDAVFSEIASAALSDRTVRNPYLCFISCVHKRVLDPLLRQGTSEEAVSILKTRAREIFNIKKTSLSDKRGVSDGPTIRYSEDNTVPRANGVRR